ncbi:unnamed protein product, partial [Polarella glacialis]
MPSGTLSGSRAYWSSLLNLDSLSVGRTYKVCADLDGAAGVTYAVGDSGLTVLTGGPSKISKGAIVAQSAQRLPIVCNAGCSTSTAAYLGTSCDDSERKGLHAATGTSSTASVLISGYGSRFDAVLDASNLLTGTTYFLCMDLDGSEPTLAFGSTKLTVIVTSIKAAVGSTLYILGDMTLRLNTSLADGGLLAATAYLSTKCSPTGPAPYVAPPAPPPGVLAFPGGPETQAVTSTAGAVDGTVDFALSVIGISAGGFYRTCVDEDGSGPLPYYDVEVPIFVTPVPSFNFLLYAGVPRKADQKVTAICYYYCSAATRMYVTSAYCNPVVTNGDPGTVPTAELAIRSEATNFVFIGPEVNKWTFTVDATSLAPGRPFKVCVDADGPGPQPFGETGVELYTSPFSEILTGALQKAELQQIVMRCPVYLAIRSVSPSNLFARVRKCDRSVRTGIMAAAGFENTNSVPIRHFEGDLWTMDSIDASGLTAGRYYGICADILADIDGPVETYGYGDTGFVLFISAVEKVFPTALPKLDGVGVQFTCPYCNPTSDVTQYYLDLVCDTTKYFGDYIFPVDGKNTYTSMLPGPGSVTTPAGTFALFDTSGLDLGQVYQLCIDVDGDNAKLAMGDSSFRIYITDMTQIKPLAVQPAVNQVLVLPCPLGCSTASMAYLSTSCDNSVYDGVMLEKTGLRTLAVPWSILTTTPLVYQVSVNATSLVTGQHYRFCTDLDGAATTLPYGDTSMVIYASPVPVSWVSTIYLSEEEQLRLSCSKCSVDTRLYLLKDEFECDYNDNGGQKVATADQTAAAVTMLEDTRTRIFFANVDVSHLVRGLLFRVCLDLDGVGTNSSFGDIGHKVYTAAVTDSGGTIFPRTGQVITMTCDDGCTVASLAYLATTCDSTYTTGGILSGGFLHSPSAPFVLGQSGDRNWKATINAQDLKEGQHYKLCTDLDGALGTQPMGVNRFAWYATGVVALRDPVLGDIRQVGIRKEAAQTLFFSCGSSCSTSSTGYLATACDSTDFDGLRTDAGIAGTASANLQAASTAGEWTLTFDGSLLTHGMNYQLCVDSDGTAATQAFGYAGVTAYCSAVISTPLVSLFRIVGAPLTLNCVSSAACPATAIGYLAAPTEECAIFTSAQVFNRGAFNTEASLLVKAGATYTQDVVASSLGMGAMYRICVDLDGDSPSIIGGQTVELTFGWTGLEVYLSTVIDITPRKLTASSNQVLQLSCTGGGCSGATVVYLSSEGFCDIANKVGVSTITSSARTASARVYIQSLKYYVDFDCSGLKLGDLYNLCVDVDGVSTDVAFGNTGVKVWVGGPMAFYLWNSVLVAAGQSLILDCALGCSNQSTAYLALDCDSTSFDGAKAAVAGTSTKSYVFKEDPLQRKPSYLQIDIDSSGLTTGTHYRLCVDMDGRGLDQASGDSGLTVYANPFVPLGPLTLNKGLTTRLPLSCPVVGCSTATMVYLSTACDTTVNGPFAGAAANGAQQTASATLVANGNSWELPQDTSLLTEGGFYYICCDLDGIPIANNKPDTNPLKVGVALEVYITGVFGTPTDMVQCLQQQSVLLNCPTCTTQSQAYLGTACDTADNAGNLPEIPLKRTAAVNLQGGPTNWEAVVDATRLAGGVAYRICLDADGTSTAQRSGDTLLKVYASGIIGIPSGDPVQKGPGQLLSFTCSLSGGCTTGVSVVYLTTSCDTTETDGIIAANGEQFSSAFPLEGPGPTFFTSTLNTSRLEPGRHYKVCSDLDGYGPHRMGDTGLQAYVSGLVPGHPRGQGPSPMVQRASGQVLKLNCPIGCNSTLTEGYLAEACVLPANGIPGVRTPAFLLEGGPADWTLEVDASGLVTGQSYQLCLDLDGASLPLLPGNSWRFPVYVTGAISSQPPAIQALPEQSLLVTCSEGCTQQTTAHLALVCEEGQVRSPNSSFTSTPGGAWELVFDASSLIKGGTYRLCVDLDGESSASLPAGDSGLFVYVTGIVAVAPHQSVRPGRTPLKLECTGGCSAQSSVYIATASSCDDWVSNGVMVRTADRTHASLFIRMGPYWMVPLRTSATLHQFGVRYRLCADLDGVAESQGFGDTGLMVFVSPVSSVLAVYRLLELSSGFVAAPGQKLVVTCTGTGCSSSTEVHIAEFCDAVAPVVLAPNITLPVALTQQVGYEQNEWIAEFDTSRLQPGATFELCIDLDGASGATFEGGGTGMEVYISPVTALPFRALQLLTGQKLVVGCEACTEATELHLTFGSCVVGDTGQQTTPVSLAATSVADLWAAMLDASSLTLGAEYKLCADLDGTANAERALGDTGLTVYITAIAALAGGGGSSAVASPGDSVQLRVACTSEASCGPRDEAFLATACADPGDLDPDAAPSSARRTAFSALSTIAGYPLDRSMEFQTGNLEVGRYYRLCTDLDGSYGDGSGVLQAGDTGVAIYFTPLTPGAAQTLLSGGPAMVEIVNCRTACTNLSQAHLATNCDPPVGSGMQSDPRAVNLMLEAQRWWMELPAVTEAAGLLPFHSYKICLDVDGETGPRTLGDSGREVFVSGFAVQNITASMATASTFRLQTSCATGCSGNASLATSLRLAAFCDPLESNAHERAAMPGFSTASAGLLPDTDAAGGWSAVLDISGLRPGQVYRVCADGDGPGPFFEGDAGWKVYASPVQLETVAIAAGSGRRLIYLACVPADSCPDITEVRLAPDCDTTPEPAGPDRI